MKIVCDACQAKYSISDDKVQGKVFKIRCKKCSNIIVVRGGAGRRRSRTALRTGEGHARLRLRLRRRPAATPAGDEAVWHLVIDQDQVGPMTVAEVQQRFAAGEVDAETFTWREGFADWLPLAQVDAFAGARRVGRRRRRAPAAAAAARGGRRDVRRRRRRRGAARRAAIRAICSRRRRRRRARRDATTTTAAICSAAKPAAARGAGRGGGGNSKLRGERNENSVLFSLNNLAQLASDKPRDLGAVVVDAASGHATGAAGGEGSGLIDIRSMASAYLGGGGAAVGKPATASAIGSIDDLPVFGGGGFSEPAVIVPTAARGGEQQDAVHA